MKINKRILSGAIFILLSHGAFAHNQMFEKTQTLDIETTQSKTFVIEAGAGSMIINSVDSDKIGVNALIKQKHENDDYCLSLTETNNVIKLKSASCFHSDTVIDLNILVPKGMNLNIKDGSGSIIINDMEDVVLKDGSGSIIMSNINGSIDIKDGSGSIELTQISDNIMIEDGSGSINIQDVIGKVTISDGSGSIYVDKAQSFELIQDGSGSVHIDNVSGDIKMNGNHK